MTSAGVVFDASALVEYSRESVRSMSVDELLREMREDTGQPVVIPWFALVEALPVVGGDREALARLESFTAAHGVRFADTELVKVIELVSVDAHVSRGLAHAMLLAPLYRELATYEAAALRRAGFDMSLVLDLGDLFHG